MLEGDDFHARTARIASPNTAKVMIKGRGIHAETSPECRRIPSKTRADSASLPRIPNAQHARGMIFDDTEPAPRRASPHRATSHHRQLPSRASTAPNRIAAAGRYRLLLNYNAASRSQITGKRAASPATGRRRCDSGSRSFLCARALPQRSRLRFRAANEFSWWRQSTRHRRTA